MSGRVQGVGFRPFIYNLATSLGLKGYVRNDARGVEIVVEGERAREFVERFANELPPLATIERVEVTKIPPQGSRRFEIKKSQNGLKRTFISPDMSICKACLADIFDSNNRRYRYPFINCTHCGPRYTIITDLPYDRKNTTMAPFVMCKACQEEYEDPASRFFHAQPISCPDCGPRLYLGEYERYEAIRQAAKLLGEEKILAIKGVGGYHLVCKAKSLAVEELRRRKRRGKKPFAVMFKDIEAIKEACAVSEAEERLITSKENPIVILKKKEPFEQEAPDIDRLGVFLPYNPIYVLLFDLIDFALVVTSANISDEPIIKDEEKIRALGIADEVLWYDRKIERSCDDSVAVCVEAKPLFFRLGRGFAPRSFKIMDSLPPVLAVGAQQKSTIALGFEDNVLFSPHIGDIANIESFEYFTKVVEDFCRMYDIAPQVVLHDLHPMYETTKYAKSLGLQTIGVQHHLAHVYAVKAEMELTGHRLKEEKFLALAWDGTGFGTDGAIWGGEFFVEDERVAHFDYFDIVGGERAIKDIRLSAWSLAKKYGIQMGDRLFDLGYEKKINTFTTSSVGRLFDAVAYFARLASFQEYEGYTGLLIEKAYRGGTDRYDYDIKNGKISIDFGSLIQDDKTLIPTRFLNTLADIVVRLAKEYGLPLLFSGGVFQNKTLLELSLHRLQKEGISHFIPSLFPINDAAISLGQLWWAKKHL